MAAGNGRFDIVCGNECWQETCGECVACARGVDNVCNWGNRNFIVLVVLQNGERAVCATFDNRERSARHAFRYTNTQQAGFVFVAQKNLWLYRLD
jgi:Zn-dependent alcohol dehydrogenase